MFISHSIVLAGLKVGSFTLGRPGLFSPALFPALAVGSIGLPRTQPEAIGTPCRGRPPPRGAHSRKAWTLAAGPEEIGGGNLVSPTDPDRARARHDYVFPGFAHFRTERLSEPLTIYTASSLHCLEEGPWTRPNQAGPTRLISNQGIIDTYLSVALLAQFRTAGHLGCLSFSCRPLANSIIEKPCYPRSCGCSARPPSTTLCLPPQPQVD